MRSYLKIQKDRLSKSLLVFDAPKGITGVACLTWEREGSNDDQWTFLPAMGNWPEITGYPRKRVVKVLKKIVSS